MSRRKLCWLEPSQPSGFSKAATSCLSSQPTTQRSATTAPSKPQESSRTRRCSFGRAVFVAGGPKVSITVPHEQWQATLRQLRICGRSECECVVYWLVSQGEPSLVTKVCHPIHAASAGHYEVDQDWLNRFWMALAQDKQSIRVQVHTHYGRAFHSRSDDTWPIVHTSGFLSLVLAGLAASDQCLSTAYLAEYDGAGRWHERPLSTFLHIA
jgi:hypothetical protein